MTTKVIPDSKTWNDLLKQFAGASFLQSFEWGEYQRNLNRDVVRLAMTDGSRHVAIMQWIIHRLPLGFSYAYVPFGPLVADDARQRWHEFASEIIQQSRAHLGNPIFLLLEPKLELCDEAHTRALAATQHLQKSGSVQPQDTRLLDLKKSEDELLSAMHQKTRYNIRLAEKHGVTISQNHSYIDAFIALHRETSLRDQFTTHADSHFSRMVKALPESMCRVYVAEYKGKIIAANIVLRFGHTVTYLHGASASQSREVMAPHLLQWQQIQDAKREGFSEYDFWGIAPANRPSPKSTSWEGITRFKNGFGGKEVNYVGAYVLPTRSLWYRVYRSARRLR